MRHRTGELLAGNRTRMLNALRGHLAEIGVVAAQGAQHAYRLKRLLADGHDEIEALVEADDTARRLMSIPGIGPITAAAIVATVQEASAFAGGRSLRPSSA